MKSTFFSQKLYYLRIFLLGAFFLLISSLIALAWNSLEQRALSPAYGALEARHEVHLLKLERDVHGEETDVPIPGAEFYLYDGLTGERISGPYVTDELGEIKLNLPPGAYCFEETNLPPHHTFDVDAEGEPIRRYCFTVDEDETEPVVVIVYNRRLSGQLIISKTVDGELAYHDEAQVFEFTVTFSEDGTYFYRINDGERRSLENGGTLRLRAGERAVFDNLPVGITYLVVETPVPYYLITSDNHQGTIFPGENWVRFVNTRQRNVSQLIVTKEVRGDTIDRDREFEFGAIIDGQSFTFTLRHGEEKVFEGLPIGAPYVVWEVETPGYTGAPDQYVGYVLSVPLHLPFVNHRLSGSGEMGSLEISKTVEGAEVPSTQPFIFQVLLEDLPDDLEFIVVGGTVVYVTPPLHEFEVTLAHGERLLIEHLPPGVRYTVVEQSVPGYLSGIVEQSGLIVADERVEANFVNESQRPDERAGLRVRKVVEGEVSEAAADANFHFVLEIDGDVYEQFMLRDGEERIFAGLPVGGTYVVREVDLPEGYALVSVEHGMGTLTREGITVTFTNRYLPRVMIEIAGTKTWELRGEDVTLPEYIVVLLKHDEVVVATARVTPDENGEWTYGFTVPKYDDEGHEINYTLEEQPVDGWMSEVDEWDLINTFIRPVTSAEIPVIKRLIGDSPSEASPFQFILQPRDGAPLPDDGQYVIVIVGAGQESFGTITFREPGTFNYVMSEIDTGTPGYVYDPARYLLTIVVEEVEGDLVITSQTLMRDDEPATEIAFINRYTTVIEPEVTRPPEPEPEPQPPTPPVVEEPEPPLVSPEQPNPPPTGDPTSLRQWVVVLILSGAGLIVRLEQMRQRKKND